jgi:hypothetical protein
VLVDRLARGQLFADELEGGIFDARDFAGGFGVELDGFGRPACRGDLDEVGGGDDFRAAGADEFDDTGIGDGDNGEGVAG